jgi:hypothetical protein
MKPMFWTPLTMPLAATPDRTVYDRAKHGLVTGPLDRLGDRP